ncbi:MAG: pyrroline-5-carboxylate reductase [Treponema sp.]|jgi:pyrroline-5-carboxylate reductase|nr:pyrroline-5-carboxylate reductase [Treponema sp.]
MQRLKTIACIGAGNMGTALMKGAIGKTVKNARDNHAIGFADTDNAKARAAAKVLGAKVFTTNAEAAKAGDYIFLAVKPQVLSSVLAEISPVIRERYVKSDSPVLISMAAGFPIKKIQAQINGGGNEAPAAPQSSIPVMRIMPNTPSQIFHGMIVYCVSPKFPSAKLAELEKILSGAGLTDQVDEEFLDAVTGISGSGPAFVFQFIEALADGGVLAGLPRDKALLYAAQTVKGAAAMVLETGKHPGELKDMVASPGGTTIQGIAALERSAFRGTVISAVEAAWQRAQELG